MTRDAIVRLSERLARAFTYGELAAEIADSDGLKIDGRGYAGALEAVAVNIGHSEPLWTSMVVNADSGEPGEGFWRANPHDPRYSQAALLSSQSHQVWLTEQRNWCIAAARVMRDPLDTTLREAEAAARDQARDCLIELLMADRRQ
jgi:hypothetical protein